MLCLLFIMKKENEEFEDIFNALRKITGIVIIIAGIAGFFLPIIPGILLIILGIALFSNKSIKRVISRLIKKAKKIK